jgi:hypothetical protein
MLDDFDDICVTTEAELPLELFGVKSYTPIHFSKASDVENYLRNVLSTTRVTTWKLEETHVLHHCNQIGYPISGPRFVEVLLSVYGMTYKPNAQVVIYKACPFMPWHIPESINHFPQAKFLHIIRDPRAVFYSQMKSIDPFTGKPFSRSALKTAMDWKKATSLDPSFVEAYVLEVNYENLLAAPEATLKLMLQYLAIGNETKTQVQGSFASRMEAADQNLHTAITSDPDQEKISAWEQALSEKNVILMETYLSEKLLKKGYEKFAVNIKHPLWYKFYVFFASRFQTIKFFLKRILRVLRAVLSNPTYLMRKSILKVNNG